MERGGKVYYVYPDVLESSIEISHGVEIECDGEKLKRTVLSR